MVCDRIFLDKSPSRLRVLITQVLEVNPFRASFVVCNTCDTLRHLKCSVRLGVTFIDLYPNSQMHEIPTVVKLKPKEGFMVGGA